MMNRTTNGAITTEMLYETEYSLFLRYSTIDQHKWFNLIELYDCVNNLYEVYSWLYY